jgi:hypothetical protein
VESYSGLEKKVKMENLRCPTLSILVSKSREME